MSIPVRRSASLRPRAGAVTGQALGGVVIGAIVVATVVLALLQPSYVYWPDEPTYEHLARSLAHGEGFAWRGEDQPLRAALYVYLITPAWMIASGGAAYVVAKLITATLCCLVAVPVWLLVRRFLSTPLVILSVVLVLSGSWMASAGSLLTESVGLPLATASLAAMVDALARRSSRSALLAIGLALVAAWSRMQLVVLLPILFLALAGDVLRSRRGWRTQVQVFRAPLLILAGLGLAVVAATAVAGDAVTGGYNGILDYRPGVFAVAHAAGLELLVLAPACGLLPVLLVLPLMMRPAAWAHQWVGPLLCVVVSALAVLAVQNGFYVASTPGLWAIQRYMVYAAPMALVLFVAAAHAGMLTARVVGASAVLGLGLLATPQAQDIGEQRAVWATAARVRDLVPGIPTGLSITVVAMLLCGVAAVALRRGRRPDAIAFAGGLAMVGYLLLQTGSAWQGELHVLREARRTIPADASWLDHHRHGPVAVLEVSANAPEFGLIDFFNDGISRYYAYQVPVPGRRLQGGYCRWYILSGTGAVRFQPRCNPDGDEYFVNDPGARLRFYGERGSYQQPLIGRLVTVRGPLHLRSLVMPPCDRFRAVDPNTQDALGGDAAVPCRPEIAAHLWLRRAATLIVSFRDAPFVEQVAVVGSRRHLLPPATETSFRVPLEAGANHIVVKLSWAQRSPLDPVLRDVELEQGGHIESLL